ncbi:helix-turn-helix domain-containing protein [Lysinimonas soli]|uniref:Helix-turn-helix domain-containing protein n=1 Tax=Lysinimonas soli TaxID=1074233 RepID=A0ABW0NTR3_9MICO
MEARTSPVEQYDVEPVRFAAATKFIFAAGMAVTTAAFGMPTNIASTELPRTVTSGLIAPTPVLAAPSLTTDALIRRIRDRAALTWDQIARLFGVSRRSVHHWASGENMSAHNIELLSQLYALVTKVDAGDPVQTRTSLFTPEESGISPVETFKQRVSAVSRPNPEPATKDALLGAE